MKYMVDIDNTICKTNGNNYTDASPVFENIDKINRLFMEGHEIIYYTSRGGTTGFNWTAVTTRQLNKWGCMFHYLRMDKPSFDVIIDDKALRIEEL